MSSDVRDILELNQPTSSFNKLSKKVTLKPNHSKKNLPKNEILKEKASETN